MGSPCFSGGSDRLELEVGGSAMLEHHPTQRDFEGLLRVGETAGGTPEGRWVVRHLLAECAFCRERLHGMGWKGRRLERLLNLRPELDDSLSELPYIGESFSYDAAFAAAERALDDYFAPSRPAERSPEDLLAELATLDMEEQIRRVSCESRFASPEFVRYLVERSHAMRYEDGQGMLDQAKLAHLAAEACTVEIIGSERRLADVRARGWGQFANALRVRGRMAEAEDAFATAQRYCETGTGDPPLRARLLEQLSSLRSFQRRFDQAIELAETAGGIYREIGDTHSLASTLVQKAIATLYDGDAEAAVRILNRAIPLIDHEEDPHLLLAASHNLVRCYIDLDRPDQGLTLYFEARDLYKEFKHQIIQLRAAWQEGQLLRDLGHLRSAETVLLRARKGFLDQGLAYEVALVALDLAAIYVRLGAATDLKQTVSETMPIFRSLRIGREALASLLQLQQVADQEHQALALIRSLVSRLEDVQQQNLAR